MKTLLVDTNRASAPLYRELVKKGHDVWVVGNDPNETLAKMANNYVNLDYSDEKTLAAFIQQHKFDFLVPGCTDASYVSCAKIGGGLLQGIDTLENTLILNLKDEFKAVAERLRIPTPKKLSKEEAVLQDSIIIKPVDSFSGRGVKVLHHPSDKTLIAALDDAIKLSGSRKAIIEEYKSCQLYSYSCFIRAGKVDIGFFVQEDGGVNPFSVDTSKVVENMPSKIKESLRLDVERIAGDLCLVDGLVHLQFLSDGDEYWVIEITRRCPGDIYSLLIEFSTGYNYAASYVAPFVGENFNSQFAFSDRKYIVRHTITSGGEQVFWGLQLHRNINLKLFVPLVISGEPMGLGFNNRIGVMFLESDSEVDLEEVYGKLVSGDMYKLSLDYGDAYER